MIFSGRYSKLIDDLEYERERARLKLELANLHVSDAEFDRRAATVLRESEDVFSIAHTGYARFVEGDQKRKKEILAKISSNLSLRNKILLIEPKKTFRILQERSHPYQQGHGELEPRECGLNTEQNQGLTLPFSLVSG